MAPESQSRVRKLGRTLLRVTDVPRVHANELYGNKAIARIVATLPPVERAYAFIRFTILRPKLLSIMDLLLPERGRVLDVGCGFGLMAAYFGQTEPGREIVGVDPDARRVGLAREVARKLGNTRHEFRVGDVRDVPTDTLYDAVYLLDVMHHIPESEQFSVLERLHAMLAEGGTLILKDITTEPRFGLRFTELLDRVMIGWDEPLKYRHHSEWGAMLQKLGFSVRAVRVPDVLPYPHVILAARKPRKGE